MFLDGVAVNFAELCVSGISYLSGSQAVSGLTAAVCELITACIQTLVHPPFCPGLFNDSFSFELELCLLERSACLGYQNMC